MTDPYKVLGISEQATDEEVKAAYRELAKKYHPDAYNNNPLADLAAEKMKEINEAYDTIMDQRKNGGSRGYNPSGGYGGYRQQYSSSGSQFSDIRNMINANRIAEAEELLDGVPASRRDAEWYFLKGSVFYTRGWLEEASSHFSRAVTMAPNNPEYRAAYNQLMWQRNTGTNRQGPYRTQGQTNGCNGCDMCSGLICADCCCECMGGDLISCC